ncbi:hypothetical protein BX600DRAFT_511030 [Xylariales sp. PMI_506]|nr:hypothetical protein BX600DRAFT_511030 [Xylariales sp. PMI_506]
MGKDGISVSRSQSAQVLDCEDCGDRFSSLYQAEAHAQAARHMTDRHCQVCRRLFESPLTLKKHESNSSWHRNRKRTPQEPSRPRRLSAETAAAPVLAQQPPTSTSTSTQPPDLDWRKPRQGQTSGRRNNFNNQPVDRHRRTNSARYRNLPQDLSNGLVVGLAPTLLDNRKGEYKPSKRPISQPPAPIPDTLESFLPEGPVHQPPTSTSLAEMANLRLSEQSSREQTKSRSKKKSDDTALKPLIFRAPPEYPEIDIRPTSHMRHGNNEYTNYSAKDQAIILEALKLRCHSEERLVNRFLVPDAPLSSAKILTGVLATDFKAAPAPVPSLSRRRAVVLDCEMVGVLHGAPEDNLERSELGQLCVVDVLSGETLMDCLVLPLERVINWRTRYSGLSYPAMLAAGKVNRLLRGWRAARAELFHYIDSDTIIMGHDLSNDLQMLRIAHAKIIDTSIQTAEAVYGDVERFGRIWGLKDLGGSLVGLKIQMGKKGHDCIEDTLATREVALWCIRHPAELAEWSNRMRFELIAKKIEAEKKLEERRKQQGEERQRQQEADREAMLVDNLDAKAWPEAALPPLGS